jgi:predicted nuclease with RNAse H fold
LPSYAGIDLTCSSKKGSAYALLRTCGSSHHALRIDYLFSLHEDSEIIDAIERDRPPLTGIDAPLSLPRSLHCLNDACSCLDPPDIKGRQCERELAMHRIPCFFTTKRSIIRDMVSRALNIKEKLSNLGFDVIEVYPYASKVRLWGKDARIPRKTTAQGIAFLKDRICRTIAGIEEYERLNHDQCDAIVAAYTAFLHGEGLTELIGDPDEGQIAIPRVS